MRRNIMIRLHNASGVVGETRPKRLCGISLRRGDRIIGVCVSESHMVR
ncbi:hypothetical protein FH063_001055 [Azospirillum argentinense]|uniref:Uncharacterized protein n=1 Tax=Azospirillum argentinense TaxID=2970906 RepID=A0A5B0L3H3_9PROT|nr:hypothetical protein FH063_001055 [Azospirillum argentinense]